MKNKPFTFLKILFLCTIILFSLQTKVIAQNNLKDAEYVVPTLSPDALPYNPEKPEELQANQLYAKSAILIDFDTGKTIFEKNANEIMYPASTTKIFTTYLGIMLGDMQQTVYLSKEAADVPLDSSTIGLKVGESIKMKDLLYATMICSGNEGSNLITEIISGSPLLFTNLMNQMANAIGCKSTHFSNAHGYFDVSHFTTARDMAHITRTAMINEIFRDIATTGKYTLPKSNMSNERTIVSSTNEMLDDSIKNNEFYYPYAIGIKTGYHSRAGYCFVGAAQKEDTTLLSVVFYTSETGRWTDTIKLMEYGFSQVM